MQNPKIPDIIRAGGYEALLLIGGALALTAHPTMRNAEHIAGVLAKLRERRNIDGMIGRGLVASGEPGTADALRLTKLGRIAMAGGRIPEEAWSRPWDQSWRMIAFDLPADARKNRTRFWRWLRSNHMGRLQGSLWITPDPAPDIEKTASDHGFDPSAVMVCTGRISGHLAPKEIAAKAWQFTAINSRYRRYTDFAVKTMQMVRARAPSAEKFRKISTEDQSLWWEAVHKDPLLPRALLPNGYEGLPAWKTRQKFHKLLFRRLPLPK